MMLSLNELGEQVVVIFPDVTFILFNPVFANARCSIFITSEEIVKYPVNPVHP